MTRSAIYWDDTIIYSYDTVNNILDEMTVSKEQKSPEFHLSQAPLGELERRGT